MRPPDHRVGRVVLDAVASREVIAPSALEARLSAFRKGRLPQILARAFDEAAPAERRLVCDRIELDLGEIPVATLEETLEARLAAALRERLARETVASPAEPEAGDPAPPWHGGIGTGAPAPLRRRSPTRRPADRLPQENLASLMAALTSGARPFPLPLHMPLDDLLYPILQNMADGMNGVLAELAATAAAQERIAQQTSDDIFARLCVRLGGERGRRLAGLADALACVHRVMPFLALQAGTVRVRLRRAALSLARLGPADDQPVAAAFASHLGLTEADLRDALADRTHVVPAQAAAALAMLTDDRPAEAAPPRWADMSERLRETRHGRAVATAAEALDAALLDATREAGPRQRRLAAAARALAARSSAPVASCDEPSALIRSLAEHAALFDSLAPAQSGPNAEEALAGVLLATLPQQDANHRAGMLDADAAARALLQAGPAAVAAGLACVAERPLLQDALPGALPWSTHEAIFTALAPEAAGLLVSLLRAAEPPRLAEQAPTRRALWIGLYEAIVQDTASSQRPSVLLGMVVGRAARRLVCPRETFAATLLAYARQAAASASGDAARFDPLCEMLAALFPSASGISSAERPETVRRRADGAADAAPAERPPPAGEADHLLDAGHGEKRPSSSRLRFAPTLSDGQDAVPPERSRPEASRSVATKRDPRGAIPTGPHGAEPSQRTATRRDTSGASAPDPSIAISPQSSAPPLSPQAARERYGASAPLASWLAHGGSIAEAHRAAENAEPAALSEILRQAAASPTGARRIMVLMATDGTGRAIADTLDGAAEAHRFAAEIGALLGQAGTPVRDAPAPIEPDVARLVVEIGAALLRRPHDRAAALRQALVATGRPLPMLAAELSLAAAEASPAVRTVVETVHAEAWTTVRRRALDVPLGGFAHHPPLASEENRTPDEKAGAAPRGSPHPAKALPWDAPGRELDTTLTDAAGTVLLWPFLERYFAALGLAEIRDFASTEAARAAAALLEWLVRGDAPGPEALACPFKLLCGLPPTTPTAYHVVPDVDAEALGEGLLRALIGHWAPLQSSSPAALRETFLLRPGRLRTEAEADILDVTAGPFDMLIDRLPFALSPIRLPFMRRVLLVQWR